MEDPTIPEPPSCFVTLIPFWTGLAYTPSVFGHRMRSKRAIADRSCFPKRNRVGIHRPSLVFASRPRNQVPRNDANSVDVRRRSVVHLGVHHAVPPPLAMVRMCERHLRVHRSHQPRWGAAGENGAQVRNIGSIRAWGRASEEEDMQGVSGNGS